MSTSTESKPQRKVIHAGTLQDGTYLLLRKEGPDNYTWWNDTGTSETETGVTGKTIEEAIKAARNKWKNQSFRTVICGFRYTLPERDEHGVNALFHQMISSYSNPTGVYQDDELGHSCLVQAASDEALRLWKKLKQQNRLI
jgi:hypothetical protein